MDSSDLGQCARLGRYVFGQSVTVNGRTYRYPGFVELEGVRYLGQSVLFVERRHLGALRSFLRSNEVDHVISEATLGPILPN